MVSSLTLACMHLKLEELLAVLVGYRQLQEIVGDLLQLPSVTGKPVHQKLPVSSVLTK